MKSLVFFDASGVALLAVSPEDAEPFRVPDDVAFCAAYERAVFAVQRGAND